MTCGCAHAVSAGLRGGKEAFTHPIVSSVMPGMKNGVYPIGDATPPSVCAEPGAVSSFIKKWEDQNNGGRQLDPSKPKDANKIKKCLGSINSVAAQQTDGKDRAPCPNCSQLIQNLRDRWGVPKDRVVAPGNVMDRSNPNVEPGRLSPGRARFSPPDKKWR